MEKNDEKPTVALTSVTVVAITILVMWFGVFFIFLSRG